MVTIGFFVGVAPSSAIPRSAAPSLLSLFYGVLSSLFIALHAVLIKSSLPHCNNSTIQLAWWTNVGSAIFLLPAVIIHGEPTLITTMIRSNTWDGTVFFWGSLITGFFGFLLCIAGLLSIKVTSPITHMFSSVRLFWFFLSIFHLKLTSFQYGRLHARCFKLYSVFGYSRISSLCAFLFFPRQVRTALIPLRLKVTEALPSW
jgi:hypothetical protein